jgi:hypothetical protein
MLMKSNILSICLVATSADTILRAQVADARAFPAEHGEEFVQGKQGDAAIIRRALCRLARARGDVSRRDPLANN